MLFPGPVITSTPVHNNRCLQNASQLLSYIPPWLWQCPSIWYLQIDISSSTESTKQCSSSNYPHSEEGTHHSSIEIPTLATGGVQTSVQAPHVYIQSTQWRGSCVSGGACDTLPSKTFIEIRVRLPAVCAKDTYGNLWKSLFQQVSCLPVEQFTNDN
jgi:hypothetical protein